MAARKAQGSTAVSGVVFEHKLDLLVSCLLVIASTSLTSFCFSQDGTIGIAIAASGAAAAMTPVRHTAVEGFRINRSEWPPSAGDGPDLCLY
jgi:hypothetical protein